MSTVKTHGTLSLDELFGEQEGPRRGAYVGRNLGVQSFSINAARTLEAGEIVTERDETGYAADRHEKVYVVLSGHAVFTIDGEEVDAPAGTVVHIPDPEVRRGASAKEPGTTLLGLGGRPGEPYRPTPGEALAEFFPLHKAKDFEGAAAVAREVLEEYPGSGLPLYNLACCDALLGNSEDAITHLRDAIDAAPTLVENARDDEDFAPIRDDPRFGALTG
jgi:tetratricopeptide (TPR) repeat protein